LNDELKAFAKSAKDRGLIKFYGFSTHSNMAACMAAAAKTDWIDVIMAKYSFREMGDSAVNDAVGACHKAGIGLVAMKTQAKGPESDAEKKLLTHFLQKGYTPEQAKVKAVWQDERISSICSQMPNVAILVSNVAAALDKTKLVQADFDILNQYAAVCGGYCAGCSEICSGEVPVGDLMRIAMYHNSYGNTQQAREELARMDSGLLSRMAQYDFGNAESRCPQRLQIGRIVRETLTKLA
jgi:predicted aldo/keto reductase-like oxidoreductase